MKTHIIDELRPEVPAVDPVWEAHTLRRILDHGAGASTAGQDGSRRRVRVVLAAAAVAALIAGVIVARITLPASDVRPAEPVEDVIQTIDPATATRIDLDVVHELPRTYQGDPVYFTSFASESELLGSVTPAATDEDIAQGVFQQSHPVIYDVETQTFTLLDASSRPRPTQVVDLQSSGSVVVWAELVGAHIGISTFSIYSYDRQTTQVRVIAEFDDPDGQIVYGDDLDVVGDTAYFSTLALPAKRGQDGVYAVPVDGSRSPTVIARGGEQIRIVGETVTYSVRNPKDDEAYPTYFSYDIPTQSIEPLPVSSHLDEPGFCGAEFTDDFETWCVGQMDGEERSRSGLLRIREASGRTTELERFPSESRNASMPHDVITLGRWTGVTMTTDDGQDRKFLIDLDTKEVRVFPDNTSFGALSPDRSMVLVSSYAVKGPGPQRIVRLP